MGTSRTGRLQHKLVGQRRKIGGRVDSVGRRKLQNSAGDPSGTGARASHKASQWPQRDVTAWHGEKHDLRHSYATGALKAGVNPKVVSDRIGHANIGFFLQTYAHVLNNDHREAAEQAPSFLLGSAWGDSQDGLPA